MATRHASCPRESEARRLQRDVDSFTKTISLQLRHRASLEASLRELGGNITRKREEMKTVLLSHREINRLEGRLEVLNRQLVEEKAKLSKDLSGNEALKAQITEYRREKVSLNEYFKEKQRESLEMSQQAQSLRLQNLSFEQSESTFKLELLTMREKASKRTFDLETQSFAAQTERKTHKTREKRMSISQLLDQTVYKDSVLVLRGLDSNWRAQVKRAKERVESYNKTINVLRDSLEEIRTATGLGVLRDIVTAVVKSNEQERMIVEQLGKSAAEAEYLHKVLSNLRAQRQAFREGHRAALEQQSAKLNTLKHELETLRDMLTTQTAKRQKLTQDMQAIFPLLQHLLSLFQTFNIPPNYSYPQELLSCSESELLTRINALEAGLSYLLTYLSAGLPVLNGSDLSPKAFNSAFSIVPPHGNSELRLSEDSDELPLTEAEFRSRAARRVPIPKLW